jgi:hypothetical protein
MVTLLIWGQILFLSGNVITTCLLIKREVAYRPLVLVDQNQRSATASLLIKMQQHIRVSGRTAGVTEFLQSQLDSFADALELNRSSPLCL